MTTKVKNHLSTLIIWLILGIFAGAALWTYRANAQESQGTHCNNFAKTKEADKCKKCRHATECVRLEDAGPDPKCARHCREDLCKCIGPCET